MDVEERSREFVEDEGETVVVSEGFLEGSQHVRHICKRTTYETNTGDCQSADGVDQRAYSSNVDVLGRDLKVPQEVSSSESLNHAASWCITPESTPPVHLVSLFILENDPQRSGAYEDSLDHGDPVDVPVESRALVEAIVYLGTDKLRNGRGKDMEDEMVTQEAEEDLMDMVRKCCQAQLVGE